MPGTYTFLQEIKWAHKKIILSIEQCSILHFRERMCGKCDKDKCKKIGKERKTQGGKP